MNALSDRIEREILLKAPCSRIWQALSHAESFGDWFGVALKGQHFTIGARVQGHITYPGYEHLLWHVTVERVEPERWLSFRWHPYAVDASLDYSQEPTTLVLFELEQVDAATTLLRLVESGFDGIPPSRHLEAFRMNSQGWDMQMKNIQAYVATA